MHKAKRKKLRELREAHTLAIPMIRKVRLAFDVTADEWYDGSTTRKVMAARRTAAYCMYLSGQYESFCIENLAAVLGWSEGRTYSHAIQIAIGSDEIRDAAVKVLSSVYREAA